MDLQLFDIGKRYAKHWLFRHIEIRLSTGDILSIQGGNGFGKSTLMQIIYGFVEPTEGQVMVNGHELKSPHQLYSYTGPYMELPLSCSIKELYELYHNAHKIACAFDVFFNYMQLAYDANAPIQHMSSGQLQKLKTALCFCSNAPVLLLDEPLSNIDQAGEEWYKNCLGNLKDKIVIIAGNYEHEFSSAQKHLDLRLYKAF